jgi:ribosome biogenesis GTPase
MASAALEVRVVLTSAVSDDGLRELEELLEPGTTVAFVGSSGVGKSTLINRLLGEDLQVTAPLRSTVDKGRHTTTRRELLVSPAGVLLIDTPGMRELALWDAHAGLAEVFADVVELGERCRFRDCRHAREPGCAVREAAEVGLLPAERLHSYRRLADEVERADERARERERQDSKKRWKGIYKESRRRRKLHAKLGLKDR